MSVEPKSVVPAAKPVEQIQTLRPVSPTDAAYLKKADSKPGWLRHWLPGLLVVGVALGGAVYWFLHRPVEVMLFRPTLVSIHETIASSGLVGGVRESMIGASFNGLVVRLDVQLGDHVEAGQALAVLKNNVTQAQVKQAETAVVSARAQLKLTSRGPLASDLQVTQMQVSQAKALAAQAVSELELARKTQARTQELAKAGVVSRSEVDATASALAAAEAKSRSGTASIRLAEAQLQSLRSTPRKEDVELARDRLKEAEQALLVVRQEASEASIVAPFSGTITAVHVELGQIVNAQGLFGLVSDALEIRIDLDESNLADITVGQKGLLSASAFPGQTFEGRLKEISPSINTIRGTVSIKLEPISPPAWLKSGQTLNVNLVTSEAAPRLLVPASALRRSGDRTVALVVEGDRAFEKNVLTRPPTANGIPVLAGLETTDLVIVNPQKVQSGDIVRIKK